MPQKKITPKKSTQQKQADNLPKGVPIVCRKHIIRDTTAVEFRREAEKLQDEGLAVSIDVNEPYMEVCIATANPNESTEFFDRLSKFFTGGISIKNK